MFLMVLAYKLLNEKKWMEANAYLAEKRKEQQTMTHADLFLKLSHPIIIRRTMTYDSITANVFNQLSFFNPKHFRLMFGIALKLRL